MVYNTTYARKQYYLHAEGSGLHTFMGNKERGQEADKYKGLRGSYWGQRALCRHGRASGPLCDPCRYYVLGRDGTLMSEKATITAMREWLKTCPLIAEEQSENGAAFRISGLSPEPVAEFSIEDSPTDPVTAVFFSGRNLAKSYIFVSRRDYSEAQSVQIANSGFFEQLTEWVLAQNDRHHLPRLGGRKEPLRVSVTSSGYIVAAESGSCKMQMQLRLEYYQPKG
ncbi:MAG: hypothetical protein ACLUIR_03250 [Faecalibacterium prausnitzii]